MRTGPYRDNVKRAMAWLRGQQDPKTGLIGTNNSVSFIYNHSIATLAMVEAYGLSGHKSSKKSAQRAIDYLEWHRNPYAVWRYQPRDGDNRLSYVVFDGRTVHFIRLDYDHETAADRIRAVTEEGTSSSCGIDSIRVSSFFS